MKNVLKKLIAAALSAALVGSAAVIPAAAKVSVKKLPEYVEGEVIAVLKDNAAKKFTTKSQAKSAYGSSFKLSASYCFGSKGNKLKIASLKSATLSTRQMLNALKDNSAVKYAFPNFKKKALSITDDAYSKYQWALENNGMNNGTKGVDTAASKFWNKAESSENEQVVAVIDTGIDAEHEDLKDVLWNNPFGTKLLGKHGYDFSGTIDSGEPTDDNGHGSHVAGIIAGTADNKKGISGINKSKTKIMALKFLTAEGSGDTNDALACFDYISRAKDLGANVVAINCSYGGIGGESEKKMLTELFDELGKKGIITCCAAGNEALDNDNIEPDALDILFGIKEKLYTTPCTNDSRYCISVAASDEKGELASFSNYGKTTVDVAAPGTAILSSVSHKCFNPTIYDAQTAEKVITQMQNYDSKLSKTSFGYPTVIKVEDSKEYTSEVSFARNVKHFGDSGKSLCVKHDKTLKRDKSFIIEIPYTLEKEEGNYSISLMCSSDEKSIIGTFADVPADFDTAEDYDDLYKYGTTLYTGDYWGHIYYDVDTSDKDYVKSKERKLVIDVSTKTNLYIDDIAVSRQDVSDDFGKYDFYSGTSMATPYVAGAVALLRNSDKDLTTEDIVSTIINTGVKNDSLTEKTVSGRYLNLSDITKIPPIISSIDYDKDGKVEVLGSFKNNTSFKLNGESAQPESADEHKAVFADNDFNTKKLSVSVENEFGSDEFSKLLSVKKEIPLATNVFGEPGDPNDVIALNAGDFAYYVDKTVGSVSQLKYEPIMKGYELEYQNNIDIQSIVKTDDSSGRIAAACYSDGKIYFSAVYPICSKNTSSILGYDTALGVYDVKTAKTEKICELPESALVGSSVASLGKDIYVLGGYNINEAKLSDEVYKLNYNAKKLEKTEVKLPQARAYTSFIEYKSKLVGVYGVIDGDEVPPIITFDGSSFKTSAVKLESDDTSIFSTTTSKDITGYYGNVGIGENGVFCNGAYFYGCGDCFTYNPETDAITPNEYTLNNKIGGKKLIGTTVIGAYIGYTIPEFVDDEESVGNLSFDEGTGEENNEENNEEEPETIDAYLLKINNGKLPTPPTPTVNPTFSKSSLSLKAGAESALSVKNGKAKSWSSSDKKIATVKNGKVTALKKGTAKITATLTTGKKLTATVKVKTNPTIKIGKKNYNKKTTYKIKKKATITATITGKAKTVKNSYKSSDKKVAKVISKANAEKVKIKGFKKGKATVTIKVNGVAFKIKVKVK